MNLELVSRNDLMDELARRYPNLVLCLHAPMGETSKRLVWFQGDPMICMGLTVVLQHVLAGVVSDEETVDTEETI